MVIFCLLLLVEVVKNITTLRSQWVDPIKLLDCVPQHENMIIGKELLAIIPWLFSHEHAAYMMQQWGREAR